MIERRWHRQTAALAADERLTLLESEAEALTFDVAET